MAQDGTGCTPLHLAAQGSSKQHLECAALLATAAPLSLRINNQEGKGPINAAASKQMRSIIQENAHAARFKQACGPACAPPVVGRMSNAS